MQSTILSREVRGHAPQENVGNIVLYLGYLLKAYMQFCTAAFFFFLNLVKQWKHTIGIWPGCRLNDFFLYIYISKTFRGSVPPDLLRKYGASHLELMYCFLSGLSFTWYQVLIIFNLMINTTIWITFRSMVLSLKFIKNSHRMRQIAHIFI